MENKSFEFKGYAYVRPCGRGIVLFNSDACDWGDYRDLEDLIPEGNCEIDIKVNYKGGDKTK